MSDKSTDRFERAATNAFIRQMETTETQAAINRMYQKDQQIQERLAKFKAAQLKTIPEPLATEIKETLSSAVTRWTKNNRSY